MSLSNTVLLRSPVGSDQCQSPLVDLTKELGVAQAKASIAHLAFLSWIAQSEDRVARLSSCLPTRRGMLFQ